MWRAQVVDSEPARFIQGLIGVAAALLKLHMREAMAAHTLWQSASDRFSAFRGTVWMGLDIDRFLADLERYLAPLVTGSVPSLSLETPSLRMVRSARE